MAVTWENARAWRLRQQFLRGHGAASVEEVVGRLIGVPAWSGDATMAIRIRPADRHSGNVADALDAGRIILTYSFRGSTHLMTPEAASVHLVRCRLLQRLLPGERASVWCRLAAMRMVKSELTGFRLAAQRIATSDVQEPVDVVRWMLGMQAQDLPGARWSIGLRMADATERTVEKALASGEIVRSWPMRGTLHIVTPDDLGWLLDICAPRQAALGAKRRRDLEITDADLSKAADVASDAMSGGHSIRRDTLLTLWQRAGISTAGQRGYHLLWNLGQMKHLVFGPSDGKLQTFALYEEWVTAPRSLERDEALAEFAGRYFSSHGPATVRDFAWWAGITASDARRGVAAASGLQKRDFNGIAHYCAEEPDSAPHGVHALPGFDEYMLGYQDRSPVLPAEFANRIVPGGNGMFKPTIVADGQVVGTWKRNDIATMTRIEFSEFTSLSKNARAGFKRAAVRYGQFVGKTVQLS